MAGGLAHPAFCWPVGGHPRHPTMSDTAEPLSGLTSAGGSFDSDRQFARRVYPIAAPVFVQFCLFKTIIINIINLAWPTHIFLTLAKPGLHRSKDPKETSFCTPRPSPLSN